MALRKPMVWSGTIMEQLQAGDTLDAPSVAGGDTIAQTNDEVGAIVIGTPVYNDANDGVKKAKADASATKDVLGLVTNTSVAGAGSATIQLNGILTATTAQWDTAFGTSGGLVAKTRYYLSAATAGLGSATAPSTVGQYICQLGRALSTTELLIEIQAPILL